MEGSSIINGFMVNGFESMNLGITRSWNRKCSAVMDSWLRVANFPYSHGMAKPIRSAEVSSNPSFAWASSQEQGTPTCLLESIPNSNHISPTWYSRHICQVTLVPSAAVAGGYPDLLTFLMAKKLREEHGEELRRASWQDLAHGVEVSPQQWLFHCFMVLKKPKLRHFEMILDTGTYKTACCRNQCEWANINYEEREREGELVDGLVTQFCSHSFPQKVGVIKWVLSLSCSKRYLLSI